MDMTKFTYVDSTGQPHKISEHGKTWVSDEWLVSMGWTRVADDYEAPISSEILKAQKLAALDSTYEAEVASIVSSLGVATLNDDSTLITELKTDMATLTSDYKTAREVIENG